MSEQESQARCPACSALVRGEAQWCSLCHADLRPKPAEPDVVPATAEVADSIAAADGALAQPGAVATAVVAGAGRHRRIAADLTPASPYAVDDDEPPEIHLGQVTARDVIVNGEIDDEMLAALLAGDPNAEALGRVSSKLDSTGKKVGVIVGAAVLVCVVVVAGLSLVGLIVR